jgi:hypothetical protein
MVPGATIESMAMSGFRMELPRIGLPIAMATGRSLLRGVGPGSKTSLGDLRHSTMDAGQLWGAAAGVGCLGLRQLPGLSTCVRPTRRRWLRSSEEELWRRRSNSAGLLELV